ncbi:MAG: helix-turn-helix domain-containing protein [Spirochaetales bacterium]|jgi:AraC family transcriptional regulator of adaptative response / DNA-3-methyladenine glycosylase II|nr:helix-turn-helix domain-containing protein [Spirochaetales bacterium]
MEKISAGMALDAAACYAALCAHDARFDGRFFVGVSSTGVYCRPVCRVKVPMKKNCAFFVSAAAAEAAGFRPCLKCRPELAPGHSPADGMKRIARQAAAMLDDECIADSGEGGVSDLAAALGVTDRHLRRVFSEEFGVSPVHYVLTRKLLLAKSLLTDTKLSITGIAMSAGFGSIRRFNDAFRKRYKLTPGELRKNIPQTHATSDGITVHLDYRPPYAWDRLISFLAARVISGVEYADDKVYRRTVRLAGTGKKSHAGWISVSPDSKKNSLAVTVSSSLLPVLPKVLGRIRALFDINCEPSGIYEKLLGMNDLAPDVCVPGIRVPGCFDPFEMSVRAVLGQLITVKAARTLTTRLAATGIKIKTPFDELSVIFPSPRQICRLEHPTEKLGVLGINKTKARAIFSLAEALVNNSISLSAGADPEVEMKKLLSLPGFGEWTVHYIGMRALHWPDAFPHTDYGIKKALAGMSEKTILNLSQKWRPWRAYAAMNLWNSLEHNKGD